MAEIVDAINAMEAAISGAMLPAMLDVAQGGESDPKTGHTFPNRTGTLEKSLTPGQATGNLPPCCPPPRDSLPRRPTRRGEGGALAFGPTTRSWR